MNSENKLYSISQAAELIGVSADTLRRWEEEGLYQPVRTSGGQRRYDVSTLKKLRPLTRRFRGRKNLPSKDEVQFLIPAVSPASSSGVFGRPIYLNRKYLNLASVVMVWLLAFGFAFARTEVGKKFFGETGSIVKSLFDSEEAMRRIAKQEIGWDENKKLGKILGDEFSHQPLTMQIASGNLLKNPSFETKGTVESLAFWQLHPNSTNDNTQMSNAAAHSGGYSLLLSCQGNREQETGNNDCSRGVIQESTKTEAKRNYQLGVWVKIVKGSKGLTLNSQGETFTDTRIHLALGPGWDRSFEIRNKKQETRNNDGWEYYSTTFSNPPPGLVPRIYVVKNKKQETGNNETFVFLDDAVFAETESLASAYSFQTLVPSGGNVLSVTADGILYPTDDSQTQGGLGTDSNRFGKAWLSNVDLSQSLSVNEKVDISGKLTANGNVTLGNNDGDEIEVGGRFISDLLPKQSNAISIGTSTQRWNNLFTATGNISNTLSVGGATTITGLLTVNGGLSASGGSGLSVTGDLALDGDLDFQGPQNITTTSDNLTISPTGSLILDSSGGTVAVRDNLTVTGNANVTNGLDVTNGFTVNGTSSLGDGGSTNYLSISNTGDLTMNGTANNIIANNDLVIRSGGSLTLDTSASNNNLLVRTGSGTFDVSAGAYTLTTSSYTQTTNGSINRTASGNITDRITGANNYVLRVGNSASDSDANGNDIFISAVDKITLHSASFTQNTSGNTETIVSAGDYSVIVQGNNDLYLRGGGAGRDDATNGGDLQLSAEDQMLLDSGLLTLTSSQDNVNAIAIRSSRGGITLSTSNASGNGNLSLLSAGSLILDTSRTTANIFLQGGLVRVGSGGTVDNISGSGSLYVQNNLEVDGNVYLGTSTANSLSVSGYVTSNLIPNPGSQFDLGSNTRRWSNLYADTVTASNIAGTVITGSTSAANWTIDVSNATADLEDVTVTFERGTEVVNSELRWNSSGDRYFSTNASFQVSPDTGIGLPFRPEQAIMVANDSYGGRRLLTLREAGSDVLNVDSSGNILLSQASNIETSSGALTVRGYSGLTLTTSSATTGEIRVISRGTLQLDTSTNNDNILLRAGSGNVNVSSSQLYLTGNLVVTGTETFNGVAYTFPGADGLASNVLTTSGTGLLSWGTLGAGSITADSLDFSEFKDELTLDADTSINGDYSLIVRAGLGSIQNSTSGSNDLQLSAEDKLILGAASFDLLTSSGGIDMISGSFLDLSSRGTLTLDTSANNSNILLKTGSGNINVSTGTLLLSGTLDIHNTTGGSFLYANATTGNLGIGTTSPTGILDILGQCVTGDTVLKRRRRRRRRGKNGEWIEEEYFEEIRIDQIREGDEILTLDEVTGQMVVRRVNKLMDKGIKSIYELTTATGKTIRTTGNHPYLVAPKITKPRIAVFIDAANFEISSQSSGLTYDYKDIISTFFGDEKPNIRYYKVDFAQSKQRKFFGFMDILGIKIITKPLKIIEQRGKEDEHKANFDVEISVDAAMLKDNYDLAVLFSGDSDFTYLVSKLQKIGKQVIVVAPWHVTGRELRRQADMFIDLRQMPFIHQQKTPRRGNRNHFINGETILSQIYPFVKPRQSWGADPVRTKYEPCTNSTGKANTEFLAGSRWIKVSELKAGQMIAAEGANNKPVFEKIVSIKRLKAEQVYDIEVEGTHNFVGNGIVAHNTTGILMRAGASSLQLSSSATSTTADIELAAADRIDLFAGSMTLSTSSRTAGELRLTSSGSLILDTSGAAGGGAPIALQAGSGNINLSSTGTITLTGNTSLNNGTLRLNGLTYTFPGADSANGVLLSNGSGGLSWTTIGASSITADSLDFSEFKDEMTLDADTSINGDYSLIVRAGLGAIQNSTSGSNDLQLSAEDKLILAGASFDLSTSNGAVDIISNQRLDLSSGGTLTLDTSSNNSNILLKTGSGNINVSTGTLTMTGVLDVRDSTGTLGLVVDSTGNVGIGTTGPTNRLQIYGTGTQGMNLQSSDSGQVQYSLTSGSNSWTMFIPGSGTDLLFWDTTERARFTSTGISLQGDTDTYWSHPSNDVLAWTTGGISRVTLNSSGNLGIGTTGPLYTLDVSGGTRVIGDAGVLLRAGRSSINLSSGTTSTTADLQFAAADRIDMFASSFSLTTSNTSDGSLKLTSYGNLTLDTSQNNGNINLRAGSGSINLSSGTTTISGNVNLNSGTLALNGIAYTFPGADSANGVLLSNGSGVLSWTTLGAGSITADSLDFSEFKDELTLDADTTINGDYSLVLRTGLGSIQNSTSGSNDLQLSAEDKLILAGASFDLSTSNGAVDIISNQRLDLSAGGTLTLDTSSNNSNILLKTGSGNINVSTGTLTMTGLLDIRDSTGTLALATDANGNVGIGTTGPGAKLDISAAGGMNVLRLTNGYTHWTFGANGRLSGYYGYIDIYNTSLGNMSLVNTINDVNFGNLILGTNGTERVRITNAGNVGIGTTGPLYTLDVSGGTRVVGDAGVLLRAGRSSINLSSGTTSTTADLQLAAADRIDLFAGSMRLSTSSLTAGDMVLSSNGSMTFDTSGGTGNFAFVGGNVGVGTTSPGTGLDIQTGTNANGQILLGTSAQAGSLGFRRGVDGLVTTTMGWNGATEQSAFVINNTSGGGIVSLMSGFVGVGTTAPSHLFEVNKSATGATEIFLKNPTAGTGNYAKMSVNSDTATLGLYSLSSTFTSAGIHFASGNTIDASGIGGLSIAAEDAAGIIRFYSGGTTERVRIDNAGNLGIASTSPAGILDIGTSAAGILLRAGQPGITISSSSAGNTADIQLAAPDRIDLFAGSMRLSTSSLTAGDMVLSSNGSMTFDTSGGTGKFAFVGGNVGIGTTNPGGTFSAKTEISWNDATGAPTLNLVNTASSVNRITGVRLVEGASGDTSVALFGHQASQIIGGTGAHTFLVSQVALEPLIFYTGGLAAGNERVRIDSTGNLGIGTTSPGGILDVIGNSSLVLRAGQSSLQLSGGATSTTADIQLAAADRIDMFASSFSLTTSNTSDGSLKLTSYGNLTLDTSQGNKNILLRAGTGSINLSSGTTTISGNVNLNSGTLALNGVAYTFPGADGSASNVLTTSGAGLLSWGTLGAASITADSLDFSEFKDEMTLDADTSINGDYSLIVRAGLGSIQNSTSGSNDLQLSAEDKLILGAASFDLLTSSGGIDLISAGRIDLSARGTLTLDTSQNNTDIRLLAGTGNLTLSGAGATITAGSTSTALGDGTDGAITVTSSKNLNTTNVQTGRSCTDGGDMVSYNATSVTDSDTVVLESAIASGCLAAGDEVLLINLQGTSSNYGNVGNYETFTISSISTTTVANDTVNFTAAKTKYYGNTTSADDTNIGTATTNQRVILQRIPQYTDVTIQSGGTITADAWDGAEGGVLFFRATGTVDVQSGGSISMVGKGYRGGGGTGSGAPAYQGESYSGIGSSSTSANNGGGGGSNGSNKGGGGGGYASTGTTGVGTSTGVGGSTYGTATLSQIFLGSGGGGAFGNGGGGVAGAIGGGVTVLSANQISITGTLNANGASATTPVSYGGSGGGGGGSIYLISPNLTVGSSLVTAAGGAGGTSGDGGNGGAGGTGRIRLDYSSLAGTTSPVAGSTNSIGGIGLAINQRGLGHILSLKSNDTEKFYIDHNGRIVINNTSTAGDVASITVNSETTGDVFDITGTSLTTGSLFNLKPTFNSSSSVGYGLNMTITDSTTAGGGYSGILVNTSGTGGTAAGNKYLMQLQSQGTDRMTVETSSGHVSLAGDIYSTSLSLTGGSSASPAQHTGMGDGSDGAITVSSSKNLNTTTVQVDRSCADGGDMVSYNVIALTSTTAQLEATPSSGCLATGDEVLLTNLQGTSSAYGNVGNWETLFISSISTDTVTFTTAKTKWYGDGTDANDTNIGTATTNQRVILQRIPQYTDVTVQSGGTITADDWDGAEGGVLFFRATGMVDVQSGGSISMTGKGYRGGAGVNNNGQGWQGESYTGLGAQTTGANGGGGGGYAGKSGGGASYGTSGSSYNNTGTPGNTYGSANLADLYMGSGGGGGGWAGDVAGDGGGIIFVGANTMTVSGGISDNGNSNSSTDSYAGSGSGGSVYLVSPNLTAGSSLVTATGGPGIGPQAAAGGNGRIRLDYSSLAGTTSPSAGSSNTINPQFTIDERGIGKILSLQSSGNERLALDSNGSLTVTSKGVGGTTGFTLTGSQTEGRVQSIVGNSITTGVGLGISLNGLTAGYGLDISSTATAMTGALQRITLSGSNASNTGSLLELTNSGTANTNTSLYIKHYATGSGNLAFRVDDVFGDISPFVIDGDGNVGIASTSPAGILDIGTSAAGILLRAGQPGITISSSSAGNTADIQLAAADRIDLFAGSLSLQTSSQTAGELKLMSKGSLILDTSGAAGGGAPIALQAGSGNINLSSTGTITLTGNTSLNNGTLRLNGLTYTFPGADSANGVLLSNGSGSLSWTTLGASSITADSLDFSEFKDEMTLDADTSINGDYSLIVRAGLGAIQNSTSGNNDIQIAAEDRLDLFATSYSLTTSGNSIDMLSGGRIDLSAKGNLTLDTSQNNTNIVMTAGTGQLQAGSVITGTSGTNLRLQATGTGTGSTGTGSIYFLDSSGGVRSRFATQPNDTTLDTNFGTGADGAITVTATKNLNTETIASGRTYADGIAYRVTAPADSATSVTRYSGSDTLTNGLAANDEVVLINLQGASGDTADVGNYEFMRVKTISSSTITFTAAITKSFDGTSAANQKIVVQRIPNYTNVTLSGSGSLTASAWDGLATTPTGAAGYLTGIVAFRATGTVTVGSGTSISVSNLGYRKGAGGTNSNDYQAGGNGGESLTGSGGTGHQSGSNSAGGAGGGGGGGNASNQNGANGTYGGGGGSGFDAGGTGGTGSSTGGAGGGGGAYSGGGGGGFGAAGGGGISLQSPPASNGSAGSTNTSGNGGSNSVAGAGGGGGGGGTYGAAALTTLYYGSGGGGGGRYGQTSALGGDGGGGGGIIFVGVNTITVSGTISANGQAGSNGASSKYDGGGGGAAGGSIAIISASPTLGTGLVTSTGGAGGSGYANGASPDLNSGGAGGNGRVRVEYTGTLSGTTSPTASTQASISVNVQAPSDSGIYGTLYLGATNTSSADLAEYYVSGDDSISAGDVVTISQKLKVKSQNEEDVETKGVLVKADKAYDSKLIGIISTNPGVLMGSIDGDGKEDKRMLALSGRVPVKIDPDSEPIAVGDFLTSSDKLGLATKATRAGYTIGKALESWSCNSENSENSDSQISSENQTIRNSDTPTFRPSESSECSEKIEVFVNLGYYMGPLTVDGYLDTGQNFIAGDVKVDLRAETYKRLMNELNLPLSEGSDPLTLTEGSDPSLAGDTVSASVAEVLSALAGKLDKADQRISTLEAGGLTLSGSYMDNEVNLGGGLINPLVETKLTLDASTGQIATLPLVVRNDGIDVLGSATIGGNLTVGLLTINDMDASINSMGETLKLQSLGLSNIEFMGGKVVMTKTGDMEIQGDLNVAGDVTAEKVKAEEVETKRLCIEDVCVTKEELKKLLEGN